MFEIKLNRFVKHCVWTSLFLTVPLLANGPREESPTFRDVARDVSYGLEYNRTRSARDDIYEAIRQDPNPAGGVFLRVPTKSRGIPGVALLDFDNDGDLDMYVTNGPGTPNSLFSNQLVETGSMTFIDVGVSSGASATEQDSSGVSFGDIDNDGDHDLYVLGTGEPNILLRNNGDGTFTDITAEAGVSGGALWSSAATMGDVNNDGLLDIYVGNIGTYESSHILFSEPFALNEHNQLFLNKGNNRFDDVSEAAGLHNHAGFPPEHSATAGPTHAVAMVDYDMDGFIDIFSANDQAGIAPTKYGGVDRGMVHVFKNDGTGNFRDVGQEIGASHPGAWMGLSFGDYNSDGYMDFFGSNMGTYNDAPAELEERNLDQNASRWYLGGRAGFTRPPLNNVNATPFGWGTSSLDYDNDGDTDIVFYGALDLVGMIMCTNPGAVLQNQGNAVFEYDAAALAESTPHSRRIVHGLAAGDLNNDGFPDLVSVSNFDIPENQSLNLFPDRNGAFDGLAAWMSTFGNFGNPPSFRYDPNLPDFPDGTLSVEINSGNANKWASIKLVGAKGVSGPAKVNRDAIGAVMTFRPRGGDPVMKPVIGGSSYASQDGLESNFGMGDATSGTLEVLWPGGVKTRLYGVRPGERLTVPELPISYDDRSMGLTEFQVRTEAFLDELVEKGLITRNLAKRVAKSAKFAYLVERNALFKK